MWKLAVLVVVGLSGCTYTSRPFMYERDQLGHAFTCEWRNQQPVNCTVDMMRVTIDAEYLSELIDDLHRCNDDEYNRRKL